MLTGTRLEEDLGNLLSSFVNLFHRKAERIEREPDLNEQAQRKGQAEQDGFEVKSVELEHRSYEAEQGTRYVTDIVLRARPRRGAAGGRADILATNWAAPETPALKTRKVTHKDK